MILHRVGCNVLAVSIAFACYAEKKKSFLKSFYQNDSMILKFFLFLIISFPDLRRHINSAICYSYEMVLDPHGPKSLCASLKRSDSYRHWIFIITSQSLNLNENLLKAYKVVVRHQFIHVMADIDIIYQSKIAVQHLYTCTNFFRRCLRSCIDFLISSN